MLIFSLLYRYWFSKRLITCFLAVNNNSLTTILRKFYCPLYTQIMDELLIMTDYKQCSFVVF
jgi:hypothetical protein